MKRGKNIKYPPLIGACKNCLGCTRLEDPKFTGVYKCKWNKEEKWEQEKIKYGTKNKL